MQLTVKIVNVFDGNLALDLPNHLALINLFDPVTGAASCVMDGTYITGVRTATAAAVAAKTLARREARTVAVIGTGVQARTHLDAFRRAFPDAKIRIAGRTSEHVRALASAYADLDVADDVEKAVRGADVVCLTTDADEPVIRHDWLAAGCHVSSVGSGHEVDADTIAAARIFVESRATATQPFPAGSRELASYDAESVTEVGEVLIGTRSGRASDGELTVYKSMGHAAEDVAAAALVLRGAAA